MEKWTEFFDMSSGGQEKEPYKIIHIEAPEKEAKVIFYNRFGHNPERVTCTCCGEDYAISEANSLLEATEYDRAGQELSEYIKRKDVLVIREKDIDQSEREGDVPQEGYVWH